MSGFSPTLLRAWERRYELLEPERQPSGHRLYTEEDLRVLRRIRELMNGGRSIGEIAAIGRETLLVQSGPVAVASAAPPQEASMPVEQLRAQLLHATLRLDERGVHACLEAAATSQPRYVVLYDVLTPCARELGELWSSGEASVANEHLFSAAVGSLLRRWIQEDAAPPAERPPAVLAAFPDELHDVGLLMVYYELARASIPVVFLGAALPLEDLERACLRLSPGSVFLSVSREALYEVHKARLFELTARQGNGRGVRFVVGGTGVSRAGAELSPAGIELWPIYRPLSELVSLFSKG